MSFKEKYFKHESDSNESFLNQKVNLSKETLFKIILASNDVLTNIVYAKNILLLFETHGHINKLDLFDEKN